MGNQKPHAEERKKRMKKPEEEKKYLRVTEVVSLLEVSESRAYKIMRQLNKELEKHIGFYAP